ncbi:dTDP-glucose 4,6-dehydratase [Candidatus Saccharibacteria bacterium]|nr:dTDP-glucose 4,6-dehydratase [Candidatus Saccharibacteria bacterium]
MNILVTGAAGFIGSNFVHYYVEKYPDDKLVVLDKLTYAGNLGNLAPFITLEGDSVDERVKFIKGDICDRELVRKIFSDEDIAGVIHFAAESHVDNSIKNPSIFVETNVLGTQVLLDVAKEFWGEGSDNKFVHISTDEVYGTLEALPEGLTLDNMSEKQRHENYFYEGRAYQANSPYSASKAGSDMIARAYFETFHMNVNITNCSNNYGPYQHEEKLIPTIIRKALANEKVPVYGNGMNVRDWLYVEDHCKAIDLVFHKAPAGEKYCIGGHNEMHNIDIVKLILKRLGKSEDLIEFVTDRKGHDFRYAIDPTKISEELGWVPETKFADGIVKTTDWYLQNAGRLVA